MGRDKHLRGMRRALGFIEISRRAYDGLLWLVKQSFAPKNPRATESWLGLDGAWAMNRFAGLATVVASSDCANAHTFFRIHHQNCISASKKGCKFGSCSLLKFWSQSDIIAAANKPVLATWSTHRRTWMTKINEPINIFSLLENLLWNPCVSKRVHPRKNNGRSIDYNE